MPKLSLGTIQFAVMLHLNEGEFTAFPIGIEGAVVGQGDTFDEALESAKSATLFHIETFGPEVARSAEFSLESLLDR